MTRHGIVKPAFSFLATGAALVATACEQEGGPAGANLDPALIVAPSESESLLGSFTLSGTIRIGTGECNGNPAQLRRIADLPGECATNPPGNTCYFVWRGDNVATSDIAATLGASAPDGSRPYSVLLNRASLVSNVETFIDWRAGHKGFNTRPYPDLRYGGSVTAGSSRILRFDSGVVPSPPVGTDAAAKDLPGLGFPTDTSNPANLASVQFEVRTPWSFTSCGAAGCTDDVVMLTINMTSDTVPRTFSQFSENRCAGAGRNAANSGLCQALGTQTARTTDRFIREYVQSDGSILSGQVLGDANTVAQRLRAELLVVPGREYGVEIRAQLRDDIVITTTQTLPAALTPPCAVLDLSAADPSTCPACIVARPNHAISGSVWLYAPDTDGVRATRYANTFVSDDPDAPMIGLSAGGTQIWVSAPPDGGPVPYAWNGVTEGRYQMGSRGRNTGTGFVTEGHVELSWGTARPLTPFTQFPPLYRWPRTGAVPAGETYGPSLGLDPSGHFFVGAAEIQQVVNRYARMGYIQGRVSFVGGCDLTPGIIVTGSAELTGVGAESGTPFQDEGGTTRTPAIGNLDALARGLFNAGDHPTAPGEFEVAATTGTWRELAYRLQLSDGDGYNGSLFVWPADPTQVTLSAPGRGAENTDMLLTGRALAVTRVGLKLKVPAGQRVRYPRVEIGNDLRVGTSFPGRITYADLDGNTLGAFVATATGAENTDGDWTEEKLKIVVMANSTVDFVPSAEVCTELTDGSCSTWELAPFPALSGIELRGSCGVCFDENNQPIEDADGVPTITVDGNVGDPGAESAQLAELPAGTTSLTVTGTITDDTPVDWSVRDGAGNVIDSGEGTPWSASLTGLSSGDNTFTIVVEDCVGNTTTMPLLVRVAEPLCPAIETPDMCELGDGLPAPGSAFYVNVRGPAGEQRAILCTVASPGQAATCDTSNLLDAQCGN